jgi:osmotically-inducible protein OsmY
MNATQHIRCILAASALVIALSACDEQPSNTNNANLDLSSGADSTVERTLQNTASTIDEKIDDASITTRVKSALIGEPGFTEAMRIDVDSRDGIVTLSGAVDSPAIINRAEVVAASTEGVRDVNNMLTVRGTN